MNPDGTPLMCWLSQFNPSTAWPCYDLPAGNTKADKEKQRAWWAEKWQKTSDKCPQYEFKRSQGDENVACFFFVDETTIVAYKYQ
ncbi:hypothetical protein NA56DRAFT_701819 [Hyaloscypha hepaticicola]|uniref:Uncharacterized protein n=1 Tax=Hyaloscypha hepaticicola TaxID=2082293 RepID=A0A2J6Q903_9HELO|nr:hypothetical protein NA56DRAFT_701819 [Hyaloscypha hepaticicola]